MNLSPIQSLAISKAIKEAAEKAARTQVATGTHAVDMIVHISGTLNVAEDTEKTPTVSISLLDVLAASLQYAGAVREALWTCIQRGAEEAIKARNNTDKVFTVEAEKINRMMEDFVKPLLAALPKTPVKGKVTTKLDVEVYHQPELAAA